MNTMCEQKVEAKICCMESLIANLENQINLAVKRQAIPKSDLNQMYTDDATFQNHFPKVCRACGTEYKNREQYIALTTKTRSTAESSVRNHNRNAIEHRDCLCGNTLILVGECRRDTSNFGIECRAYFDICVQRLMHDNGFSQKDAEELSRVIFRSVLSQASETV